MKCDVLKVPYHGRLVTTSEKFLTEASPKIAYITDDEEEPASGQLIEILEDLGAEVFTSREDGTVTVVSDGQGVSVKREKCELRAAAGRPELLLPKNKCRWKNFEILLTNLQKGIDTVPPPVY